MVLDVGCFDQQKWAVQSFERSEEVSATSNLRKEWSLCLCIIHGRSTTAQGECGREQTQELEERMVFVAIILKRRRSNTPLITTGNRFGLVVLWCKRTRTNGASSVTTCHGRARGCLAGFRNDCREARSIRFLLDWIWRAAGSGDSSSLFGRTRTRTQGRGSYCAARDHDESTTDANATAATWLLARGGQDRRRRAACGPGERCMY